MEGLFIQLLGNSPTLIAVLLLYSKIELVKKDLENHEKFYHKKGRKIC